MFAFRPSNCTDRQLAQFTAGFGVVVGRGSRRWRFTRARARGLVHFPAAVGPRGFRSLPPTRARIGRGAVTRHVHHAAGRGAVQVQARRGRRLGVAGARRGRRRTEAGRTDFYRRRGHAGGGRQGIAGRWSFRPAASLPGVAGHMLEAGQPTRAADRWPGARRPDRRGLDGQTCPTIAPAAPGCEDRAEVASWPSTPHGRGARRPGGR